jgi:hypothetical protein
VMAWQHLMYADRRPKMAFGVHSEVVEVSFSARLPRL